MAFRTSRAPGSSTRIALGPGERRARRRNGLRSSLRFFPSGPPAPRPGVVHLQRVSGQGSPGGPPSAPSDDGEGPDLPSSSLLPTCPPRSPHPRFTPHLPSSTRTVVVVVDLHPPVRGMKLTSRDPPRIPAWIAAHRNRIANRPKRVSLRLPPGLIENHSCNVTVGTTENGFWTGSFTLSDYAGGPNCAPGSSFGITNQVNEYIYVFNSAGT